MVLVTLWHELWPLIQGATPPLGPLLADPAPGCSVLPGYYGLLLQVLLFVAAVGTLVWKKVLEGKERTWCQFFLDSSKQFIGSGWLHILNMGICMDLATQQLSRDNNDADECEWYWLQIMVDTTLGVLLEFWTLRLLLRLVTCCTRPEVALSFTTGQYRVDRQSRIRKGAYVRQLFLWLVTVTFMKACMLTFLICFARPLLMLAGFLLRRMRMDIRLMVVMIITPLVMNTMQYWLQDNILKEKVSGPINGHAPWDVPSSSLRDAPLTAPVGAEGIVQSENSGGLENFKSSSTASPLGA